MQKKTLLFLLFTLCIVGTALPAAAERITSHEEWRFNLTRFFPEGIQTPGTQNYDFETGTHGLVFSNQFLWKENIESRKIQIKSGNQDWTFFAEYQYASPDPADRMLPYYALIDLKTQITELGASYRFANWFDSDFEVLAGTRYKNQETSSYNVGTQQDRNDDNDTWWQNAFVGMRFFTNLSKNWTLIGRGDIGAGKNGQFAWNAVAMLDFSPDENSSFYVGYKFLDFGDKNDIISGMEPYSYNALRQGPFIGYTIRW